MQPDNPLIGTWQLVSWHNKHADGNKTYTLGKDAVGYLSYSPDGFVFVHLMAANRDAYLENDPFGGTLAEDSAAMKSQITYTGVFDYSGQQVVHTVTCASCPNWVGTKQVRDVKFQGAELILSAAGAQLDRGIVTAELLWKRATA
jgi:hypothetical protein